MNARTQVALTLSAIVIAWPCLAQEKVYSRQRDVLVDAIRNGHSAGVMHGEVAEHFTRELRSTSALRVEARVLQALERETCKRLEMVYTKDGVPTPQGPTQARLTTQLNYCLDGGPPAGVPGME